MDPAVQLTFVPAGPVPAAGRFHVWSLDDAAGAGELVAACAGLGLPAGDAVRHPTIAPVDGQAERRDRPARSVPVLPVVRHLAALPPSSREPAWRRPSAAVSAWSTAAKLALELVTAGHVLPTLRASSTPGEALASWRVVAPSDSRPAQLAAAFPFAGHALRTAEGGVWRADDLVDAFLHAVADACARQGRRPHIDPRRRGPRRGFGEMWAAALTAADPTVTHLREPADGLLGEIEAWSAPFTGGGRDATVRLALRLDPPDDGESWRLELGLYAVGGAGERLSAATIWQYDTPNLLGERTLDDAELLLAEALAGAARLFAPLDRALDEARPTTVTLDANEAAEFLDDGSAALTAAGVFVELPAELRDIDEHRLKLRLRIGQGTPLGPRVEGAGPLGLSSLADLRYEAVLGDRELSAEELAHLVETHRPLVRWRGSWVRVDASDVARIRELAGENVSLGLTEVLAAALSGQYHDDDVGWVDVVADGQIAEAIERLRSTDTDAEARIVGIEGELRGYQRRGIAWLQRLTDVGLGAVLADQMGLGKTLQAIGLMTSRAGDRPHLVVAPTSVVGNWEREIQRFAPGVEVVRHHGPDRPVTPRAFAAGCVVITSYALLRQDVDLLARVSWDVVAFDEAQQIKNPTSKGARAARSLTSRARIALTGTPVENRLSELWSIIDVTNPGLLGPQQRFTERFAAPIERWRDEEAAARLRRLVAPFVLRRRKDDPSVHADLPGKQELTVTCSLTREQASLYQAAVDAAFTGKGLGSTAFERRGRVLALLTALKQICNHPAHYLRDGGQLAGRSGKLTQATEILSQIVDDGDRALVFTQFREMGELLRTHLAAELAIPDVPFLHGGVPLGRRDELVRRFQEDDDASPVLLVSLRAGGVGVNLTRARHVLHYDRWWNPAVEDQATDRVHRIGQTEDVTVHAFVTEGTVEERIAALLERKRALADAVVGTDEAWISQLDDEELRDLVALSDDLDVVEDPEEAAEGPADEPGPPRLVALPGGRA